MLRRRKMIAGMKIVVLDSAGVVTIPLEVVTLISQEAAMVVNEESSTETRAEVHPEEEIDMKVVVLVNTSDQVLQAASMIDLEAMPHSSNLLTS